LHLRLIRLHAIPEIENPMGPVLVWVDRLRATLERKEKVCNLRLWCVDEVDAACQRAERASATAAVRARGFK
jgi:hypothetical protein